MSEARDGIPEYPWYAMISFSRVSPLASPPHGDFDAINSTSQNTYLVRKKKQGSKKATLVFSGELM